MIQREVRMLFSRCKKGEHIMTPTVLAHEYVEPFACEMSTGTFMGDKLYGVSVLETCKPSGVKRRSDLSRCFNDRKTAENYIKSLGELAGELTSDKAHRNALYQQKA